VASQVKSSSSAIYASIRGASGFGIVSLAAFSVWALGGKWTQVHLGEAGLYGACALVFLGLSGLLLHPLLSGPGSFTRFYAVFVPAFAAYAVVWCGGWFILHFGIGEWLGSLLGTFAFVGVTGWRFRNYHGFLKASLILFVFHSAGYFLGGHLMHWIMGPAGSSILTGATRSQISLVAKLAWGLLYGLGFGAGIGFVFYALQREPAPD